MAANTASRSFTLSIYHCLLFSWATRRSPHQDRLSPNPHLLTKQHWASPHFLQTSWKLTSDACADFRWCDTSSTRCSPILLCPCSVRRRHPLWPTSHLLRAVLALSCPCLWTQTRQVTQGFKVSQKTAQCTQAQSGLYDPAVGQCELN